MRSILTTITCSLLAILLFAGDSSAAVVKSDVYSSSATTMTGFNVRLRGSLGQPNTAEPGSAGFVIREGFWPMAIAVRSGPCCQGATGNIDNDPTQTVDISDLTTLVNHLFVIFQPLACPAEANTNGDTDCTIDVSDLTKLVNHLFVTFESLAACQSICE